MTDKPFVPERIYVPTKLNGALKGDKFFETPIDGVEYIREDVLKEEYAQKILKAYDMKWNNKDDLMAEELYDAIEAVEYEMALNMSDAKQWLKNLKQRLL